MANTVMILGAGGQLGTELRKVFPDAYSYFHDSSEENRVDFNDLDKLENIILEKKCRYIINASAMTNVDGCEENRELAYRINGTAVGSIARAAANAGSTLVHISTDYVFDGKRGNYNESDVPSPINFYGLSKLVGDIYALSNESNVVVRTSGVYGSMTNFPFFAYKQLSRNQSLNVVDGIYSPIHATNLALAIKELLEKNYRGIINVAGDKVTREALAREICRSFGFNEELINTVSTLKSMKALRPYDSSLDISKARSLLNFDFHSMKSNLNLMRKSIASKAK